ncbi:MAG TPA: mechanosensitive ion channel [Leptolyngbyaceae cyanobacterium M33_DOE_097]|uniref:Mechanosensitive ion channel n=1 Tax=Oscillatoriales cyanobacterium SpSt-418 TaxID=2282169 RepID=A0A7C3KES6_9CYAN|nr:mechanosensitive ion channel [Leptolyngbyaceae cyanobacterium M33_DOE_097]
MLNFSLPLTGNFSFAQVQAPAPSTDATSLDAWNRFFQQTSGSLGPTLLNLLGAIAILLLGWLVAGLVSSILRKGLKKTNLDERFIAWTTGNQPSASQSSQVEGIFASVVFWVILTLAIVAALNVLNLTTVSQPLNNFLNQIFAFLPKLGAAAFLAFIAWVVATLARAIVTRTAKSFSLDERFFQDGEPTTRSPYLLSDTLGNALYWFVLLFFLPTILDVLDLRGPLQPVQNLLNDLLQALPNIIKAVVIAVAGWFIARIVRNIVTNLLAATGVDRIGEQFGMTRNKPSQSLSYIIGTIIYVLVLLPAAIAALDALQIPAISVPAIAMLNQILTTLPQIFTAVLILIAAYVLGRFLADFVRNLLASIGFDNLYHWLGIQTSAASVQPVDSTPAETNVNLPTRTRTPSEIAGVVVLIGIMLFAAIAALDVLNLPAIQNITTGLLVVFGRILVGLIVFAVGLYLANLAFNLIDSSNTRQSRILAQTARIAIIALVSAMALQQIGVASNIVNLAFGLLLGAIAVAIALAFGLGGRDVAGEQLREWLDTFKRN